jgi:MoaA/NifB/PqqE/SkfB family radical SAM enzyme
MINIGRRVLQARINKAITGKMTPFKLTIALTFLCNSRCKICNIWKIELGDPAKITSELELKDYVRLFNELRDGLAWIEFTGGEPFLKKDIIEIVSYAQNNTSASAVGITTNSLLPELSYSAIQKMLRGGHKNKNLVAALSLDGEPGINDAIRGVAGHFDKTVWLLGRLKDLRHQHPNLEVHLAYTISKFNAGNFLNFYKYMRENYGINLDEISITFEHFSDFYRNEVSGCPYGDSFKRGLIEDARAYLSLLKSNAPSKKLKSHFYRFYVEEIINFITNTDKMVMPCSAGTYSAYIDPYGDVYPCTMWNRKIGNIKERSFSEIWGSKAASEARSLIKRGACQKCWTPCEAQPSWAMSFGPLRG